MSGEAHLVAAASQVEQIDQRAAHPLAHVGCGCTRVDELGHVVDQADVLLIALPARLDAGRATKVRAEAHPVPCI
jgi:hypothetical protein